MDRSECIEAIYERTTRVYTTYNIYLTASSEFGRKWCNDGLRTTGRCQLQLEVRCYLDSESIGNGHGDILLVVETA